mmetsp:Transcript_3782/g.15718  ORF Transcript_3782/g.15718 Transcript_3782/m.15718 type:complete len:214 (-) Transcript_3782:545-1186(-)
MGGGEYRSTALPAEPGCAWVSMPKAPLARCSRARTSASPTDPLLALPREGLPRRPFRSAAALEAEPSSALRLAVWPTERSPAPPPDAAGRCLPQRPAQGRAGSFVEASGRRLRGEAPGVARRLGLPGAACRKQQQQQQHGNPAQAPPPAELGRAMASSSRPQHMTTRQRQARGQALEPRAGLGADPRAPGEPDATPAQDSAHASSRPTLRPGP